MKASPTSSIYVSQVASCARHASCDDRLHVTCYYMSNNFKIDLLKSEILTLQNVQRKVESLFNNLEHGF